MWTSVSSPNSGLLPLRLQPKKYLHVSVGLWAEDPAPSETSQPEKKERDLKPIPSADAAMAEPEAEIPETPPSQPVETVPLSGSARLAEALQKRNAGSPALDCGAKPKAKAKGKPKAKPSLKRPAARSDVRPAKKPASASSSAGNLKKPKPKSQAKGSKSSKSTSAVKPKMTRTCVYSRAYHGAQSIWTSWFIFIYVYVYSG